MVTTVVYYGNTIVLYYYSIILYSDNIGMVTLQYYTMVILYYSTILLSNWEGVRSKILRIQTFLFVSTRAWTLKLSDE